MRKKRPAQASAEQLVFPFELQIGDVVLDNGERVEVAQRPTVAAGGKMTCAWVPPEGSNAQRQAASEAWRRLRVVRAPAA